MFESEDRSWNLLMKATFWPADTGFNQVRHLRRPVTSKRRAGGSRHTCPPDEPAMLISVFTLFRAWHNLVRSNSNTKALRSSESAWLITQPGFLVW